MAKNKLHSLLAQAFKIGSAPMPPIQIEVPNQWTPFGAIPGDSIIRFSKDNERLRIGYRSKKGHFSKHHHASDEVLFVAMGEIVVHTYKGQKKYTEGDTVTIPAEEAHKVDFLCETELFIVYPNFKTHWETS